MMRWPALTLHLGVDRYLQTVRTMSWRLFVGTQAIEVATASKSLGEWVGLSV